MRRDCKTCCKWEKHFYWSHMDLRKISFCKKMNASLLNKMDIPNAFHKNFRGGIGETVKLIGPSGCVWQVGVIKSAEKCTFQSGWKDFVIANSIDAKDFLVFKYRDESSFKVKIFDPSECERISSFLATKEEIEVQETSDSSIKIVDEADCNMRQDKITISVSSSDSEHSSDAVSVGMRIGPACKKVGTSKDPNGGGELKTPKNEPIGFGQKLCLTPAQKKRGVKLSDRVQPGNPCFVVLMTSSNATGKYRLGIPSKFGAKHFPKETNNATLHYMNRKWPLSIYNKKVTHQAITGGWRRFVQDNNLQEGDICLFELMKNQETVSFKVHISRKQ